MLLSEHFLDSLRLTNVFCPSRNENLLLVSHIILCVHSLSWRAWYACFHSAGWLTLAPVPPRVTTASDMTCQQLQSYPNTPYSQKSLIFTSPPDWPPVWSPQPAHQASPCSSPPITDSVTPIYPPLYVAWPMSFRPEAHLSVRLLFFCLVWFR